MNIIAGISKSGIHSRQRVAAQTWTFRGILLGHCVHLSMIVGPFLNLNFASLERADYVEMDCVKALGGPREHAYLFTHMFHCFVLLAFMSLFMNGQKYFAVANQYVVRMVGCASSWLSPEIYWLGPFTEVSAGIYYTLSRRTAKSICASTFTGEFRVAGIWIIGEYD